jgi:hypothetical protein
MPAFLSATGGGDNKELPQNFGKAKVREFDNRKNFAPGIFSLFSVSCIQHFIRINLKTNFNIANKKIPPARDL